MRKLFKSNVEMVPYLGKNVPRKHFRAFIYDAEGEQKLVNCWEDFSKLVSTGNWFAEKPEKKVHRTARRR